MKKLLLAALISLPLVGNGELVVHVPYQCADAQVHYNKQGFVVEHNGTYQPVANHNLNKYLRNATPEQIQAFSKIGYVTLKMLSNGEYTLDGHVRGPGGGPVLGSLFYWGVKAVAYGVALAGAGTAVAASGGAAAAAGGALLTAGTTGATAGTSIVASAITCGGLAGEAATASTAVIASSGGIAGAVAAVESVATTAFVFGAALPGF